MVDVFGRRAYHKEISPLRFGIDIVPDSAAWPSAFSEHRRLHSRAFAAPPRSSVPVEMPRGIAVEMRSSFLRSLATFMATASIGSAEEVVDAVISCWRR